MCAIRTLMDMDTKIYILRNIKNPAIIVWQVKAVSEKLTK